MGKRSAVVELFLGDMGSIQRELRPSIQREDQLTMETKLEQIAVKAVNQLPKSVVREIRTPRSVGAGGGRPPPATRWARRNPRPYRDHAGTFHMTAVSSDTAPPEPVGSMKGLGRIERTDGDVISVRISERKLRSSSAGIHMWLFFQPADERPRPWQGYVKVVDPEEQEEAVARLGVMGTCQRGMLVGTPLVETEQDRSIRVDDLPEVVVGRSRLRQAK